MSATVTVHTKPSCVQCKATFRHLDKLGIPYSVVTLTEETTAHFKTAGYLSAPVVITDTDTWAGYQPGRIEKLKELTNV